MSNLLTVSVGLSAYNEQANISNLITAMLYQQETNFKLKEIIVVSDGSSDKTVDLVRSFGDDRVKLIAHSKRGGKAKRMNEILNEFTGDVLFFTDADVLPDDKYVLSKIVEKFQKSPKVEMVLANVRPLPAVNFFEKAVNNFFFAREAQIKHYDFYSSIHGARGAGMALRKAVAKQVVFPESLIIDDAYLYLNMKKQKLKVAAAKEAVIWFRSVQTPADFIKQIMRYVKGGEQLNQFFPQALMAKESFVPKGVMFRILLVQLNTNLIGYIYLKAIFLYCMYLLRSNSYRTSPKWLISKSSKQLQPGAASSRGAAYGRIIKSVGVLKGVLILWLSN